MELQKAINLSDDFLAFQFDFHVQNAKVTKSTNN